MQKNSKTQYIKISCINSGSSGNCHILECNGRKILLDLGVRWKEILNAIDYDLSAIDFALCTHQHADHALSVPQAVRNGIPCYGNAEKCTPLPDRTWTDISGGKILPIPIHHTNNDGSDCPNQAFVIQKDGERLLYMQDWQFCRYRLTQLKINHFVIGINYTEIPEGENRDHVLHGHASLDTVKDFLMTNITADTRSIIACHLSDQNADPEKIYRELVDIAPDGCLVGIAEKGKVFHLE